MGEPLLNQAARVPRSNLLTLTSPRSSRQGKARLVQLDGDERPCHHEQRHRHRCHERALPWTLHTFRSLDAFSLRTPYLRPSTNRHL